MKGISVVIPCLNEAETIGGCIEKAQAGLQNFTAPSEIVVADNGSTDKSAQIAARLGARVISVEQRGYGKALQAGIDAANYDWVIMGDADQSYDFSKITPFIKNLEDHDLVQGCRFPSGGGHIEPGAMPLLHRWIGNPLFSFLIRLWFRVPIHDAYCGLRAFRKDFYRKLALRCHGMEFATEMLIKAAWVRGRIAEVPITLSRDKRLSGRRHLRTWHDGWRTLRLYLMYSPTWLYFLPGTGLILAGLLGFILGVFNIRTIGIIADVHTLLFASLCMICGYEAILFGIFTKVFAVRAGFFPRDDRFDRVFRYVNLERGLLAGTLIFLAGIFLLIVALLSGSPLVNSSFDYFEALRVTVPGATLTALGFQTILSSFLISILGLHRD